MNGCERVNFLQYKYILLKWQNRRSREVDTATIVEQTVQ